MDKLEEYLERARKERAMHERNGATGIVEAIDRIFPNLFDDKDERIRKELLDFVKDAKQSLELQERDNNKWQIEQLKMYISWLENQKPQKWSDGDDVMLQSIVDDTIQENQLDGGQLHWLKRLRNIARWKPTKEQIDFLAEAILYLNRSGSTFAYKGELDCLYEDLHKLL